MLIETLVLVIKLPPFGLIAGVSTLLVGALASMPTGWTRATCIVDVSMVTLLAFFVVMVSVYDPTLLGLVICWSPALPTTAFVPIKIKKLSLSFSESVSFRVMVMDPEVPVTTLAPRALPLPVPGVAAIGTSTVFIAMSMSV